MIYLRDYIMSAAIFSFFSFVWFGWAQAEIVQLKHHLWLGICAAIAAISSIVAGVLSYQNFHTASALAKFNSFTWYLIVFYTEFILGLIGALLLIKFKQSPAVPAWISLLVGIHFIALQFVFHDPSLYLLAILMLVVSALAIPINHKFKVAQSTLVGTSNGVILLIFAIFNYSRFLLN
ncbi:hypothetical protein [Paucilactobacillus wasatchensis]|uniref:Integral membrane protein n=1 Tax=Paucilactobacillus wasatchensis TaxID=1335616 RepID=A0A0D1A8W7_9LACO|nr:hypothetical protein [Paucilactobacillus wasatchensis]KIS04280.1 hypothetical protein WDC_0017 [Paucilactobacillus wasatchensis]